MSLTNEEKLVVKLLSEAWNTFIELPDAEFLQKDFEFALDQAYRIIAMRVARRVDPAVWR